MSNAAIPAEALTFPAASPMLVLPLPQAAVGYDSSQKLKALYAFRSGVFFRLSKCLWRIAQGGFQACRFPLVSRSVNPVQFRHPNYLTEFWWRFQEITKDAAMPPISSPALSCALSPLAQKKLLESLKHLF